MAAWVSAQSGSWSVDVANAASPWYGGAGNPASGVPVAGDTVTVAATHVVLVDVTIAGAGLANLTINSVASGVPGTLKWMDGTNGTLTIATGGLLKGSTTSAVVKGRLLASSAGVWTGASSTAATLRDSQWGTSGAVDSGNVFTPGTSPSWDASALVGESITVNGTTYVVSANTSTTATLTSGPGVLTVTSWALVVRPLATANRCLISLLTTGSIQTAYLDVLTYCAEPTLKRVRTYGTTETFTADAGTDICTLASTVVSLLVANMPVYLSTTGTLPAGLATNTLYYVRTVSGATCKLSTTASDVGIVDITDAGTGTHAITTGSVTVSSISGNNLTTAIAALPQPQWSTGRRVCFRTTGTFPTAIEADTLYVISYVNTGVFALKKSSSGELITPGTSWTGTLTAYIGSSEIAQTIVAVLDDVSADTCWEASGTAQTFNDCTTRSAAVLVNSLFFVYTTAGPNFDQQRVAIRAITAGTITLGAVIDSAQGPNAELWLMSRNVSIWSTAAAASASLPVNGGSGTGGVFGEVRNVGLTGTTYGGRAFYTCTGIKVATVSGFTRGLDAPVNCRVGVVSCCLYGIYGGSVTSCVALVGCDTGSMLNTTGTITYISGCVYGLNFCSAITVALITSCAWGANGPVSTTVITKIDNCDSGCSGATGATLPFVTGCNYGMYLCNGTTITLISYCNLGIYDSTDCIGTTISYCQYAMQTARACRATTIDNCWGGLYRCIECSAVTFSVVRYAVYQSQATLRETVFSASITYDILGPLNVVGYGCQPTSVAKLCGSYLHANANATSFYSSATLYDLKTSAGVAQPGYVARYDPGGKTVTEAYVAGTHTAPPAPWAAGPPNTGIHVSTCQDVDSPHWMMFPMWATKGQKLTVVIYARQVAFGKWGGANDLAARWRLVYPGEVDGTSAEFLAATSRMTDVDNNWQTFTLSAPAAAQDGPVWLVMDAKGGQASGTGTDNFYWFFVPLPASSRRSPALIGV